MLRPSKHSHPDRTVIYAAYLLLRRLQKQRVDSYPDLLTFLKDKLNDDSTLFLPAINLLFALGLVEYRKKSDAFEFVERTQ